MHASVCVCVCVWWVGTVLLKPNVQKSRLGIFLKSQTPTWPECLHSEQAPRTSLLWIHGSPLGPQGHEAGDPRRAGQDHTGDFPTPGDPPRPEPPTGSSRVLLSGHIASTKGVQAKTAPATLRFAVLLRARPKGPRPAFCGTVPVGEGGSPGFVGTRSGDLSQGHQHPSRSHWAQDVQRQV